MKKESQERKEKYPEYYRSTKHRFTKTDDEGIIDLISLSKRDNQSTIRAWRGSCFFRNFQLFLCRIPSSNEKMVMRSSFLPSFPSNLSLVDHSFTRSLARSLPGSINQSTHTLLMASFSSSAAFPSESARS